jgi:hypothetical protein
MDARWGCRRCAEELFIREIRIRLTLTIVSELIRQVVQAYTDSMRCGHRFGFSSSPTTQVTLLYGEPWLTFIATTKEQLNRPPPLKVYRSTWTAKYISTQLGTHPRSVLIISCRDRPQCGWLFLF